MKKNYRQILISAPTKHEAETISSQLINRKLIAGSMITIGDSLYRWDKKITKKKYYNISGFTVADNKEKIIKIVKQFHSDECPIVAFVSIDGNVEFLDWIRKNII